MSEIRVESLYTYPVKSCAGTKLEYTDITERGLELDRFFMVVDENGTFISQRTHPELAVVQPEVIQSDPDGSIAMDIRAPGMETLSTGFEHGYFPYDEYRFTSIHGKPVNALHVDDDADEWFSQYLHTPAELVVTNRNQNRFVKDRYRHENAANAAAFADAFPILLASQVSLNALNRVIKDETGGQPVQIDRFRPNIVVDGEELEPYEEDTWRRIQVGEMLAYVVRPCKRCSIPYVDQKTGVKGDAKTVGKALAVSRRGRDTTSPTDNGKGVFFAQNVNHVYVEGLEINVGDEARVLDTADSNVELRL